MWHIKSFPAIRRKVLHSTNIRVVSYFPVKYVLLCFLQLNICDDWLCRITVWHYYRKSLCSLKILRNGPMSIIILWVYQNNIPTDFRKTGQQKEKREKKHTKCYFCKLDLSHICRWFVMWFKLDFYKCVSVWTQLTVVLDTTHNDKFKSSVRGQRVEADSVRSLRNKSDLPEADKKLKKTMSAEEDHVRQLKRSRTQTKRTLRWNWESVSFKSTWNRSVLSNTNPWQLGKLHPMRKIMWYDWKLQELK